MRNQVKTSVRRGHERGHANHGWLSSYHTFSFGGYHDPAYMGFRSLRVINDDAVAPGRGFGEHPHRDMEIISIVTKGALEHQDSMGNGSVIRAGQAQRISAGTGITHSEFNHSDEESVHFYQIWIVPDQRGHAPSYQEVDLDSLAFENGWRLVASPDGDQQSLRIHQDARLYDGVFGLEDSIDFRIEEGRGAWLHIVSGAIEADDQILKAGDAISFEGGGDHRARALEDSRVLLFDLW